MANNDAPISAVQMNAMQSAAVRGQGQKMRQNIRSVTVNPLQESIVTVQAKNVGLVLGFIVEVSGSVTNGGGTVATRTGLGSSNILRNITLTDLSNVQRVNTSGAHLALLNSARQGFGFGGAYAPSLPMAYGNNWGPFQGPASLAAAAVGTVKHTYYVPLAYGSDNLKGAVYAGVTGANMTLALDINPTPFVGATDPLSAIYSGNAAGAWTNTVTVNVYQVYIDQIPVANGSLILPMLDLSTIYEIKKTSNSGIVVNQDFPVAYSQFRSFLSTVAIFDNGGSYNSGSDVNYFSLVAANSTPLWKQSADICALDARQTFMADPPPGVYYFDHREKPIDTINYGNMELNLNASLVNAGAQLITGFEAFAQTSQIGGATSLAAG